MSFRSDFSKCLDIQQMSAPLESSRTDKLDMLMTMKWNNRIIQGLQTTWLTSLPILQSPVTATRVQLRPLSVYLTENRSRPRSLRFVKMPSYLDSTCI